jgi:hypothetical protein
MAYFYHVYLEPKIGITDEEVKAKFDLAIDWYKYDTKCWVVKSSSDIAKWQARLRPLAEPEGTLLIFKIEVEQRQGWMQKSFWEWVRKTTTQ